MTEEDSELNQKSILELQNEINEYKKQINDIITKADDTEITNSSNLVSYVRGLEKGKTLNLTVYRSGETKEIKLTVV